MIVTINYSYDLQGDLTKVTDPNGNATQHVYDEYGRLVKTVLPLGMYSVNEYVAEIYFCGIRISLTSITIITQKDTNNIITGFPGNGYKYGLNGLIGGK